MSFLTKFKEGYRIGELEVAVDHTFSIATKIRSNDLYLRTHEEAGKLPVPKGFFGKCGYHLGRYLNSLPSQFY